MVEYFVYFLALTMAALIPGPGIVSLVGRSVGSNFRQTLPFVFGLILGDVLYLTLAVWWLSFLMASNMALLLLIKILGGIYLFFLAWNFWNTKLSASSQSDQGKEHSFNALASGLAVTAGNPKTVLFYGALVPNVLDINKIGINEWLLLCLLTVLTLLVVLIPYSLMATQFSNLTVLRNGRAHFTKLTGLVLAFFGFLAIKDVATILFL